MRTLITTIIVLTCLAYVSRPNVTIKPFSITFEAPFLALAYLFMGVSIALFGYHYETKRFKDGLKQMTEAVKENFYLINKDKK